MEEMVHFGWTEAVTESVEEWIFINYTFSNHSTNTNVQTFNTLVYVAPFCMITIIANGLVCYAIRKKNLLRLSVYSCIFNMCISDMLSLIALTINAFVTYAINVPHLWLYQISCKFFNYLLTVSMTVSMLTFAMMAIDRYCIIVGRKKPRLIFQSKRGIRAIIACIWIYSIITGIPILHIMSIYKDLITPPRCDISYIGDHYNRPYFMIYFGVNYFLPMLVTAILHILIVIRLKTAVTIGAGCSRTIPPVFNVNRKKTINVIKMVAITTCVYIMTTFPYISIILIITVKRTSLVELRQRELINSSLITMGFFLSALACVENPIVCVIMSKMLRKPILEIYHCLLCRKTVQYRIHVKQK